VIEYSRVREGHPEWAHTGTDQRGQSTNVTVMVTNIPAGSGLKVVMARDLKEAWVDLRPCLRKPNLQCRGIESAYNLRAIMLRRQTWCHVCHDQRDQCKKSELATGHLAKLRGGLGECASSRNNCLSLCLSKYGKDDDNWLSDSGHRFIYIDARKK
jgi:hypothetical protein